MGLDMYLERFPRYGLYGPNDIYHISEYLSYMEDENAKKKYTLEQWCGVKESELPPPAVIDHFRPLFMERFYYWDTEHKYPTKQIYEQVGYWRKANEIHDWFVNEIQDGVDDCNYHREVTRQDFERLRDTCQKIVSETRLVEGKVINGYNIDKNGKEIPIEIDGLIVEDDSLCRHLLPTTSGFFFGSTQYDQYYIEDLKHTIQICEEVLQTTNFDEQMVYYCSSW